MARVKMYKPQIETVFREQIQDLQFSLFQNQIRYVYEHSPMYKRKFDEAGLMPGDVKTVDDIKRVPFTWKEDLRKSQEEKPPFGDFACVPPEEAVRYFQTSGTTGTPVKVFFNHRDWFDVSCEQFFYMLHGFGVEKSDILFVPSGYSFYVAWWMLQAAMESFGVGIVPGGAQSSEHRIRNIIDWGATIVCGTPTYMIYLGDLAKRMGIDLASETRIRMVIVAGEPGGQIPATKKLIEETWGGKCYDDVGGTEITTFGFECEAQQGVHIIESMFLPEVVNPDTGEHVAPGQPGELVLTNLCMETMPFIRYRTRDYVKLNYDKCDCGRTFARMDGGILGRTDDMFHFAGVNIFPSAIENFIRDVKEFSNEFQLLVPKMGTGKKLKIRVEPASEAITRDELEKGQTELVDRIKWRVGIAPEIEVVETGTLPRFEHKAKRLIRET